MQGSWDIQHTLHSTGRHGPGASNRRPTAGTNAGADSRAAAAASGLLDAPSAFALLPADPASASLTAGAAAGAGAAAATFFVWAAVFFLAALASFLALTGAGFFTAGFLAGLLAILAAG